MLVAAPEFKCGAVGEDAEAEKPGLARVPAPPRGYRLRGEPLPTESALQDSAG